MGKRQNIKIFLMTILAVILALLFGALLVFNHMPQQQLRKNLSLGRKYASNMDFENAELAYQAAIAIAPKQDTAYRELSNTYVKEARSLDENDIDSIDNAYQNAADILVNLTDAVEPEDADFSYAEVYTDLGDVYMDKSENLETDRPGASEDSLRQADDAYAKAADYAERNDEQELLSYANKKRETIATQLNKRPDNATNEKNSGTEETSDENEKYGGVQVLTLNTDNYVDVNNSGTTDRINIGALTPDGSDMDPSEAQVYFNTMYVNDLSLNVRMQHTMITQAYAVDINTEDQYKNIILRSDIGEDGVVYELIFAYNDTELVEITDGEWQSQIGGIGDLSYTDMKGDGILHLYSDLRWQVDQANWVCEKNEYMIKDKEVTLMDSVIGSMPKDKGYIGGYDRDTTSDLKDENFTEGVVVTLAIDLPLYSDADATQQTGTISAGTQATVTREFRTDDYREIFYLDNLGFLDESYDYYYNIDPTLQGPFAGMYRYA